MARGTVPRVVFFGMDSEFSTRPLLGLLKSGVQVKAVVKPLGGVSLRKTNMATRVPSLMTRLKEAWMRLLTGAAPLPTDPAGIPEDPFAVAEAWGIPCYVVGDASGDRAARVLAGLDVDVYCVAFFNQLLRKSVLGLPRLGTVNLHPSLLPAYRGPAPLFWMFKDAVRETGVTLHLVAPGEDDGDVLLQAPMPLEDGTRGPDLLKLMAARGSDLMVQGVWALFNGEAQPRRQDASRAFRSPRPGGEDLRVDFTRPARDVFNFVRGVSQWMPLYAQVGMDRVDVLDALHFDAGATLPAEVVYTGTTMLARCKEGMVALRIRPRSFPWNALPGPQPGRAAP